MIAISSDRLSRDVSNGGTALSIGAQELIQMIGGNKAGRVFSGGKRLSIHLRRQRFPEAGGTLSRVVPRGRVTTNKRQDGQERRTRLGNP